MDNDKYIIEKFFKIDIFFNSDSRSEEFFGEIGTTCEKF